MKKFKTWLFGDALTKIGCGIFGGSVVAIYLKPVNLFTYFFLIGLGVICFIVGYWLIGNSKKTTPRPK